MSARTRARLSERIADRGWEELRTRARQEACKRMDAARNRLGLTFAQGPLAAPRQDAPRFFFSRAERAEIAAVLQERLPLQVQETVARAERICNHEFDLLGYTRLQYGPKIDWQLDVVHGKRAPLKPWFKIRYLNFGEVGDAKITWELNRHQHLSTLARAYLFTADERFALEIFRQWYDWQRENPYPLGMNWASSLEVAFRSLSWLWIREWCAGCPAAPENFAFDLLQALHASGRHIEHNLSTYFSPNTHLLGEGAALFYIGAMCPELSAAARWQLLGWEIVCQEAGRQVRADGLHFEQSLYYHVYALDFFLHARRLADRNGISIPPQLDEIIQRMLEALYKLSQASAPSRLGDDDGGRVFDPRRNEARHMRDPLAVGGLMYGRADYLKAAGLTEEAVWLFGRGALEKFEKVPAKPSELGSVAFESAGIYVMAGPGPGFQQAVVDAGPLGAGRGGHGHADALSLTLSAGGREWLVDPGTFAYVSGEGERDAFRGTAAHNTMRIDGADQAEPSGPFRWRTQPCVQMEKWISAKTFDLLVASHTGYSRLPSSVTHRRCVFHLKSQFWLVIDLVKGEGIHHLELFWHLAPDCVPQISVPHTVHIGAGGESALALLTPEDHSWGREIRDGWYSPVYGRKGPCPVLRFETDTKLPAAFVTLLLPTPECETVGGRLSEFKPQNQAEHVRGYQYVTAGECHRFFLSEQPGRWNLGPWASDGEFVYCRLSLDGRLLHAAICGGSFVSWDAGFVLSTNRAAPYFEWEPRGSWRPCACSEEAPADVEELPRCLGGDRREIAPGVG